MPDPPDPVFLATAIDAVIRAGEMQLAGLGRDIRIDKKGTIDLVTEVDIAIERAFRDVIAKRFPDHVVLGEEFANLDLDARVLETVHAIGSLDTGLVTEAVSGSRLAVARAIARLGRRGFLSEFALSEA